MDNQAITLEHLKNEYYCFQDAREEAYGELANAKANLAECTPYDEKRPLLEKAVSLCEETLKKYDELIVELEEKIKALSN